MCQVAHACYRGGVDQRKVWLTSPTPLGKEGRRSVVEGASVAGSHDDHSTRAGKRGGAGSRQDRLISKNPQQVLAELRAKSGKDIWLFGGGLLFRSLLEARLVDAVEVSVMPVLLGEGVPLLPPKSSSERCKLSLASSKVFKTGILSVEYTVEYEPA